MKKMSAGYSARTPAAACLELRRVLNPSAPEKIKFHLEFSFKETPLDYEPGDSLGVRPINDPQLIDVLLRAVGLNGDERLAGGRPVLQALLHDVNVTSVSSAFLKALNSRVATANVPLQCLAPGQEKALHHYLNGRDLIDFFTEFSSAKGMFTCDEFVGLLPKLQPRLYSIASSQKVFPGKAHLLVVLVQYELHNRIRKGVCSAYLSERLHVSESVPVFVHRANHFHLPLSNDASVIMIGGGTGLAPFRAFIQERAAIGAKGKNWLFFGERKESVDFFYKEEWQNYASSGLLTRLDTAFSQDQPEKIYVQHRMLEHARQLWAWLNEGAYLYVCGAAETMGKDVDATLQLIAQREGGLSEEKASEFLTMLTTEKRYRRDVY